MNKKRHFTSLDSLRGFAALFVVFLHSYWNHDFYFLNFIRNSYLFVDLFFILSGFVIISAHYTYEFIEQRYRYGFFKKKSFNK